MVKSVQASASSKTGLARRLKSGRELVCESRQGLSEQSCIDLGDCLAELASRHPGMCSGIAFKAVGIGIVQVVEMTRETQLTSNTNTRVCR